MKKYIPSFKGGHHTDEAKRRIGLSKKGKKRPDITGTNSSRYGKTHTLEARKKISDSKKGKPSWNKGKKGFQKAWNKGKHSTLEQRLKISGKNHYNWQEGISNINKRIRNSVEYKEWRTKVYQRDNYTCQNCGKTNTHLQADHIKPFALYRHLRFTLSNGRTLCVPCHRKTDTYGVRKNLYKGKKALIFGITGMDGSYLTEFLQDRGYEVYGVVRPTSTSNRQRIDHIFDTQEKRQKYLLYGDITDAFSILRILKQVKPDEIYQLCAQSHVAISWETPWMTAQVDAIGMLNVLESMRILDMEKTVKIYNASTSELFSGREGHKQNEDTSKNPISPYGTAKLFSYQLCKNYRDAYGMFVASGILFNHESPRRGDNFVTKKIINNADTGKVELGNIEAKRDWGFSPEYCEAMWLILQQEKPEDFVIATGETHSVKEFVDYVSQSAGHPIKIIHNGKFDRPNDVPMLCGDTSKAEQKLNWKASIKAKELADIMYKNRL